MGEWKEFKKSRPCPICSSVKRCSYTADGAVWCVYSNGQAAPGWRILPRAGGIVDDDNGTVYRPEGDDRDRATGAAAEARRKKAEEDARRDNARKVKQAREHWASCGGAKDHPAMRAYFIGRGVPVAKLAGGVLPACLRYVAKAEYWSEDAAGKPLQLRAGPAIYCGAIDAKGDLTGIQRLYLDVHGSPSKRAAKDCSPDGNAESEAPSKKATGLIAEAGAAVRLGPPGYPGGVLCLTEGVETGLAVSACGYSTWACVSTSGLTHLVVPEELIVPRGPVSTIVIMADHDRIDQRRGHRPGFQAATIAANALATRFPAAKVAVREPRHSEAPDLIGTAPGTQDQFGDIAGGGKSVDWLDVVARGDEGERAVRAAIEEVLGQADTAPGPLPAAIEQGAGAADQVPGGAGAGGDGDRGGDGGDRSDESAAAGEKAPLKILPDGALARARLALRVLWTPERRVGQRWTLAYVAAQDQFLAYDGTGYREVRDVAVQNAMLQLFEEYRVVTRDGAKRLNGLDPDAPEALRELRMEDTRRAALTPPAVGLIMEALKSETAIHDDALPVWAPATFDHEGKPRWGVTAWPDWVKAPEPTHAAYENGILDLNRFRDGKLVLLPHSPRFVSTSCLPYALNLEEINAELARDPSGEDDGGDLLARLAPRTAKALGEVVDGDMVKLKCLQQLGGLCQTFDTSFERAGALIGPPASFKGTFLELLTAVVGDRNTAYTSFKEITERFETANLVGKNLAIIDEAHVGPSTDAIEAVRRWKSMISAMPVSADVKFGEKASFVRPRCRFIITANELPKLPDASAAMARRLVIVPFTKSFEGRQDRTLKHAVRREAAGVAAWMLFGYRTLCRVGDFVLPEDGVEMLEDFRRLSSQVFTFLKDCCVTGGSVGSVKCAALYQLYQAWAKAHGYMMLSEERFGSQLKASCSMVSRKPRKVASLGRFTVYENVRPRLRGEEAGAEQYERADNVLDLEAIAEDFDFEIERNTVNTGEAWWNKDHGTPT